MPAPGETIAPQPDHKEEPATPSAPEAAAPEPAPTTEAVSPLDVKPKAPVEEPHRMGPSPAERGVPQDTLQPTPDPRIEGVSAADQTADQAPDKQVEAQPEHKSFWQKIKDAFKGKPKEDKGPAVPKDVVNTGMSPSAGVGEQDAARKAALNAQADSADTLGLPRVMTKAESQRLPHGDQAGGPATVETPEEDLKKVA